MRTLALGVLLVLAACTQDQAPDKNRDLTPAADAGDMSPPPSPATNAVDILFLMDNSPGEAPIFQSLLVDEIRSLLAPLEAAGIDYHLAVTTSDVGTWTAPNTPWPTRMGTCDNYAGDDGALQRAACNARAGVTQTAVWACQSRCPDPRYVPAGSAGYISRVGGVTNVPVFMDPITGVDIGPQKALQCLGLVGDAGCGVEGVLEGMKRALDGHRAENTGFLRPGSLLVVVINTNEDDCSVSLARRSETGPTTRDCSVADADAAADCYNPDYRCLAASVICDEPMNTPGEKHNCRERPGSYLEPVSTYVRFLQGLRPADRLLVSGLWVLPSLPAGGKLVIVHERGGTTSDTLNRGTTKSNAGCATVADPNVTGRPQLRLSRFASQLPGSLESDVCATSYAGPMATLAATIRARLGK